MVSSLLLSILEGTDKLWHIIIIIFHRGCSALRVSKSLLQERVLLRSNLLKDIWHHVLKVFGLRGSGNNQEVFFNRELGLWSLKMNNGVIVLEHVNLVDILKGLHTEFSVRENLLVVAGTPETKELKDMMPDILKQVGPQQYSFLKEALGNMGGKGPSAVADDDADDIPELVGTFEDAQK